ncbi:helicase-related protein [Polymorphospora sp. NPDC051019]|uniref:DEAD/DEAH box helicase n=1 Tax=Polymorphospora sp. NPDC051019 TaxID=3155725 RepID=UPI0034310BAB
MNRNDLRYEPPLHGFGWLAELRPETCLVLGEVPDDQRKAVSELAPEVRMARLTPFISRAVHHGGYAVLRGGLWHGLLVMGGSGPRGPESARRKYTDPDHHLHAAYDVYDEKWPDAVRFAGLSTFGVGDLVRVKGSDTLGRISGVYQTSDGYRYEVELRDGRRQHYNETALHLIEGDPRDPQFWLSQPPAGAADVSLTLTWTKLTHPLTDTIYSFAASKTVFRAYQFKPVLKLLTASSGRLLVADEVGLGKTIEAGLIWTELEQRSRLERVLVVAPATLTLKWQAEMRRRFDRRLELLRPADLNTFAQRLQDGDNAPIHGVVSLESLRSADHVLEQLTKVNPRFDLVIVDEAHYLRNQQSRSHALGRLLADWSDYLIFLSATPLNLGNNDLFNLMSLLDEGQFSDQAIFAAQLEPNRVLNAVAAALTGSGRDEPRKLIARLGELHTLEFGGTVTDRPDFTTLNKLFDVDRRLDAGEVAQARRLLADLNTLGGVITRTRKADVPDRKAVREPRDIEVRWTDEERAYYDSILAWFLSRALQTGTPPGFATQMPLRQAASCIEASKQLMRERNPQFAQTDTDDLPEDVRADFTGLATSVLSASLPVDTKYDQLLRELLRIRQAGMRQSMIFSFFRRTLEYLGKRLSTQFTVRVMHGGVSMDGRQEIMRDFRDGKFEILLLSEVGSEGLDFEFCNVLVNYDLPWNPMRVEQRIGRLDRFGQQHEKIFIYNMRVPGTIETDIFQRLYDRIGVFRDSIGELEPILRDELGDYAKQFLDPSLDAAGRRREADRIAVAVEQRTRDLDDLESSRSLLAGIDGLLIDGLTEAGPGNGRFIGPAELRRILDELFHRLGGHRGAPDQNGTFEIIGSDRLANRLRSSNVGEGGSRYPRSKLASLLQDLAPIHCTFRPETGSRYDVELISGRHPLVKLALEVLAEETLTLPRFGAVAVPGLPIGRRYLVTVDLAETNGLRPTLELWATAVDVASRQLCPEVGEALLTALAHGELRDGSTVPPHDLREVWQLAQDRTFVRQRQSEQTRAQENAALVEGRIRARESSLTVQIRKTEQLLIKLSASTAAASIIRLHKGRLRNLKDRRTQARAELLGRKELSVGLNAIAVLLVEAAEPIPSPGTRASAASGSRRRRS